MSEKMTFLPRAEILTIEELVQIGKTFCELGVSKLRVTGGEPLIRGGVIELMQELRKIPQLKELCLTTNGTHLKQYAQALKAAGVDRINISLDTLNPNTFKQLTRVGELQDVIDGIKAAQAAGFKRIKLNCVVLKHYNAEDAPALVNFALQEGLDLSFIEEMPLGKVTSHGRAAEFMSSEELRKLISQQTPLLACDDTSGGPARYWTTPGYASRIGFISPHSENFCGSCNRVRVTATGKLMLCLGQENNVDLRAALRNHSEPSTSLYQILQQAMAHKPEKHDFDLHDEPQILRFMNTTGG
jgi:cyclic pyranopterin phosphate synthase